MLCSIRLVVARHHLRLRHSCAFLTPSSLIIYRVQRYTEEERDYEFHRDTARVGATEAPTRNGNGNEQWQNPVA